MTITLPAGTKVGELTTTREHTLTLPRIKFGVMGPPSSGKSHLIASMPKPLLGLCADPEEKLQPYFDRCGEIERTVGQFGQPVLVGKSPSTGKPIMQLELFYDTDREKPEAFTNLMARSHQLIGEVRAGMWASLGFDSWSQFERWAKWRRYYGKYALKDPEAYGRGDRAAADDLMTLVVTRLMAQGLTCNLGIAFHTAPKMREEGGMAFYGIKALTKDLPTDVASNLPERYRAEALADGVTRRLWTRPDGRYDLCTLLNVPNPCENNYQALFTNWIATKVAALEATAADPTTGAPRAAEEK